jgi:4-amino-4-deoxy-L-arabinose transferase-like glycosyltransferase
LNRTIRYRLGAVPVLLWMVLVGLMLRLAVIPFDTLENLMDADHIHAWEQGNVARSLVAGHGFGSPFVSSQTSAIMPPVYPLIIAGIFKVFGVHTARSIFAVHAFDCLINALACVPIYLVARRSFGPRAAQWSAWVWVFFPYGIYFAAAWAWSTHLLLFALLWLIYLAQQMELSPSLALWAAFGLLAGFAGLIEPSILVIVPFLLLLAASSLARKAKPWLMQGILASLCLAATISPWLIRDALLFHRFIPMRDSMGLELRMGNNGYTLRWTSDPLHPLHNAAELAGYDRMGELAYMDHKAAEARAWIHGHPGQYAVLCLRRALYLWTGYWSFDPAYLKLEPMDPFNIPFATSLTLLALAGLAIAWQQRKLEAIRYAGTLLLFPMVYYFSHPEPYHMRTLDPLMVILGCHAIVTCREKFQHRERLEAFRARP